jgi:hypothetical protein
MDPMLAVMRIIIELDEHADVRPSGVIIRDRLEEPFDGWLELLRVLESTLRGDIPGRGARTIRDSPGASDPSDA